MASLSSNEQARTTARLNAARLGAARLGYIPSQTVGTTPGSTGPHPVWTKKYGNSTTWTQVTR